MSDWVCSPCHEIATGSDGRQLHFVRSRGTCEDCLQTMDCVECQCEGDWLKARAERRAAPEVFKP